jgi:sortase (surface protein transpeptidase)
MPRRIAFLTVALGVTFFLTAAGLRLQSSYSAALQAKSSLNAASSELAGLGGGALSGGLVNHNEVIDRLARACGEAGNAQLALSQIEVDLNVLSPVIALAQAAPVVGSAVQTRATSLDVGRELTAAMGSLCGSDLRGLAADTEGQTLTQTLASIGAARAHLVAASARLRNAVAIVEGLPVAEGDAANAELLAAGHKLPSLLTSLEDVAALLALVDTSEGPRRFLVVSQNADELRGTGGYIGTAGVLEITRVGVVLRDFSSSRALDTPASLRATPPAELARYLGTSYWHLAAANWTPSFPDAARQMAYFYSLQPEALPLDGVVAMDQVAIARLLEITGPVDVPEYGERVSADDVQQKLNRYLHESGVTHEATRKEFAGLVSRAVLQQLSVTSSEALPQLTRVLRANLDEQHLLIWSNRADSTASLRAHRWDGALLEAGSSDALLLIENEVSSSKRSQTIARDTTYSVTQQGDRLVGRLELSYRDTSSTAVSTPYKTFVQALVPEGSRLLASSGYTGPVSSFGSCGRTSFGGEVGVAGKAVTTVTLAYELPIRVSANAYQLLLQQQPNTSAGLVRLSLEAAAPLVRSTTDLRGAWLVAPSPASEPALLAPPNTAVACDPSPTQARPLPEPSQLAIPAIGLTASVNELGISPAGVMEDPADGKAVGWYRTSARPGQPGNAVMSGHLDWDRGLAVFGRLADLQVGQVIQVRGSDGQLFTYAVEWNRSYLTKDVPLRTVLGPSGEDELLTLITCDGVFDRLTGDYLSRRFVRARLMT